MLAGRSDPSKDRLLLWQNDRAAWDADQGWGNTHNVFAFAGRAVISTASAASAVAELVVSVAEDISGFIEEQPDGSSACAAATHATATTVSSRASWPAVSSIFVTGAAETTFATGTCRPAFSTATAGTAFSSAQV